MDRGSYFAIDYHPKDNPKARSWLILVPLTSCQITAAEAFPWCQLDMGRVQHFAIWPSRFQKYYWDSIKNVACEMNILQQLQKIEFYLLDQME